MTEVAFRIKQNPAGKFFIHSDLNSYGPFDYKPDAEAGLQRLINPPIYEYDKNGVEIPKEI